jgi:preprotein translocase subunit SecE
MSAQRRTPTKQQSGASATVAPRRPVAAAQDVRPEPARAAKPVVDKSKGVEVARKSIIAVRTEGVRRLFRDSWSEMKKVNWPDKETTRNLTVVVIGISIILGLLLGGIDWVLVKLLDVF